MERSEGHIGRHQVGLLAMLGIAVGAAGLAMATRLWLCSQGSILCVNARLLVPGLWVVWFPLGCSLGWFITCALVVGLSLFVSLVAYARAVGRVLVCLSFARGVGLILFGWFACWPVCGVWVLVCLSSAQGVGLILFGWFG